jgi:hypothetical protein
VREREYALLPGLRPWRREAAFSLFPGMLPVAAGDEVEPTAVDDVVVAWFAVVD